MNVIARLEYELAYYDSAVHRFNHYTTRTPPHHYQWTATISEPPLSVDRHYQWTATISGPPLSVDLGVMAIKEYSTHSWSPVVDRYYQMKFSVIPRSPFLGGAVSPLSTGYSLRILRTADEANISVYWLYIVVIY